MSNETSLTLEEIKANQERMMVLRAKDRNRIYMIILDEVNKHLENYGEIGVSNKIAFLEDMISHIKQAMRRNNPSDSK